MSTYICCTVKCVNESLYNKQDFAHVSGNNELFFLSCMKLCVHEHNIQDYWPVALTDLLVVSSDNRDPRRE